MKIEFDLQRAGMKKLKDLAPCTWFVNGGLMSEPNVFCVVQHPPPRGKGSCEPAYYARDGEDSSVVFNFTKNRVTTMSNERYVAVIKVRLKVDGYEDQRARDLDSQEETEGEEQEYLVQWSIDVSATNPALAANRAWELLSGRDSTAKVFEVTDQKGRSSRVDLYFKEKNNE